MFKAIHLGRLETFIFQGHQKNNKRVRVMRLCSQRTIINVREAHIITRTIHMLSICILIRESQFHVKFLINSYNMFSGIV